MGAVFVSYRRGDSEGQATALFNGFEEIVGSDSVFMDVDSIELGRDFREVLQERLQSCDRMFALIGPNWLNAKDSAGNRRLDQAGDFVRQEIAAALKRKIPVVPILVQGAQMPAPEQLPEDLRDLCFRNGFELSHNRWESDFQEMIRRLGLGKGEVRQALPGAATATAPHQFERAKDTVGERAEPGPAPGQEPRRRPWLKWLAVGVLLGVVGLIWLGVSPEPPQKREAAKEPAEAAKEAPANAAANAQNPAQTGPEAAAATAAAETFRKLIADGRFNKLWDSLSEANKKTWTSKEKFLADWATWKTSFFSGAAPSASRLISVTYKDQKFGNLGEVYAAVFRESYPGGDAFQTTWVIKDPDEQFRFLSSFIAPVPRD